MKCATISQRAEAKDYLDIHAILHRSRLTLQNGIAAAEAIYGQQYNAAITLKALSYYGDGNLNSLPNDLTQELKQDLNSGEVKTIEIDKKEKLLATAILGK